MFKFILPTFNFNIERWKWNKEYRVYVSNMGHFRDEHKCLMKAMISKDGYISIKTPVGIKTAHRLVMLTWRPIPNAEALTIDHLDHNKRNNSVMNLEWVSQEENQRRAENDLSYIITRKNTSKISNKKSTVSKIRTKVNGKEYLFDTPEEAAIWLMNTEQWLSTTKGAENIKTTTLEYTARKIKNCSDNAKGGIYYIHWKKVQV